MTVIRKIWGNCYKILRLDNAEIDLLYLEKDSVCSKHYHNEKRNLFLLISGKVNIVTDLGTKELVINEPFEVDTNCTHRFDALEDSILLEIAYVENGKIDKDDIVREIQGGKFIEGKFYTLDELKEKNWL
jgi:quercetin dioxygenase-like cupin family protein